MIPLRHPTTVLVAGPTGCGKTEFVYKLLTTREAIQPTPQRIIFIYSEWQPAYDRMKQALQNTIEIVKDYEPKVLYDPFRTRRATCLYSTTRWIAKT